MCIRDRFYEGDGFIIDVHDFYIREEVIQNSTYSMSDYVSIYSSYIVSANGEKFNPYQILTANSLCTLDFDNIKDDFLFLLHENCYYLAVSIGFKRELLDKHLSSINIDPESFYRALLDVYKRQDKRLLVSCQKYLLKIQSKQDLNNFLDMIKQYDKSQYNK